MDWIETAMRSMVHEFDGGPICNIHTHMLIEETITSHKGRDIKCGSNSSRKETTPDQFTASSENVLAAAGSIGLNVVFIAHILLDRGHEMCSRAVRLTKSLCPNRCM